MSRTTMMAAALAALAFLQAGQASARTHKTKAARWLAPGWLIPADGAG
jgi:hypothetical protein